MWSDYLFFINPTQQTFIAFAVLFCFQKATFSQTRTQQDSLSSIALNYPVDQGKASDKVSGGDIVPPQSKPGQLTNGLTKRSIFTKKGKNSFRFNYGGRIQTRFDLTKMQTPGAEYKNDLYFRRVRFKSDGHLFNPKFGYKLEIDVLGTQVLDAYIRWNFYRNFEVWGGQTKLRGNRERVISSQNLQFVDRSLLNAKFTLDRDIGIWILHHFNSGKGVWRQVVSVSKGEGLCIWQENPVPVEAGLDYTIRLEYLPFGEFEDKGDYKGSDLAREPTPRLALGLTYDYNNHAVKSRGQKGGLTDNEADLRSWIADLMFKFRGFSVMSEYVDRKVYNFRQHSTEQFTVFLNDFYAGSAFNGQAGYVFRGNYELAARYTQVRTQEGSPFNDLMQYTFAFSKFIVGHSIKAQTDFSILQEQGMPVTHIYRLQFELSL